VKSHTELLFKEYLEKNKMTQQTQKQIESRTFRMLIGDDSYNDIRTASNALSLILYGMVESTNGSCMEGEFVNEKDYVAEEFPIKGFDRAEIRAVSSVEEMLEESCGNYDWIVTDMNYGPGYETGGKDVLKNQQVRKNRAVKAVFTSEDNPRVLEELAHMGADVVVSPALIKSKDHKVMLLGRAIAEYYINQTKQVGGDEK
jgi:hypothetical protein